MVKNIIYYPTYHHNHYDNMKYIIHNQSLVLHMKLMYSHRKNNSFKLNKNSFLSPNNARQKSL